LVYVSQFDRCRDIANPAIALAGLSAVALAGAAWRPRPLWFGIACGLLALYLGIGLVWGRVVSARLDDGVGGRDRGPKLIFPEESTGQILPEGFGAWWQPLECGPRAARALLDGLGRPPDAKDGGVVHALCGGPSLT
jgi:hypothetical protein